MKQMLNVIDHRDQVRVPVSMKVILCSNSLPVMSTETLNISRDGVLLDTGSTVYEKHEILELEFQDLEGNTQQWYRLSAEVIHSSRHGLGLKFHRPSTMHALMSHMVLGKLYHLNS